MLVASDIGEDSKMADEMCGAVDYQGIKKEHLSEAEVRILLDKLLVTKEIEQHHTERFLAWVGEHFPDALFELVLQRLDRDAEFDERNEKKAGYTPIPHHRFGKWFRTLKNGPKYQAFLEQASDRLVARPGQGFWLRGLFWAIASIDSTALGVIDELVHRGEQSSAQIALQLLEGAPNELALTRPYFAAHVIDECNRTEARLGGLAETVFLTNAQTGPFNRTPGQPSPKYLSMKERKHQKSHESSDRATHYGAPRGPKRNANAVPCGDWPIPSLQSPKRDAHRITEANGHARGRLSRLAQAGTLREEGRKRHPDSRSDHSAQVRKQRTD